MPEDLSRASSWRARAAPDAGQTTGLRRSSRITSRQTPFSCPMPLAAADDAEPGTLVQAEARLVLGEDARLDRPDAGGLGRRDERIEQGATDAAPARLGGDVDAVLDDARRRRSARRRPRPRPSRRPGRPRARRSGARPDAPRPTPPTTAPRSRTSRCRSRSRPRRCAPRRSSAQDRAARSPSGQANCAVAALVAVSAALLRRPGRGRKGHGLFGRLGSPPPSPMRPSLTAKSQRVCDRSRVNFATIRPPDRARRRAVRLPARDDRR